MSIAAATTDKTASTKYTYNYTYLPPLAMVGAVSEAEAFSARPEWVSLVAVPALKILVNNIMIAVKHRPGNTEFVSQVLKDLDAVARRLPAGATRGLTDAIDSALARHGTPSTLPELKALLEGVIQTAAPSVTLELLLAIGRLPRVAIVSGRATSLDDFNQLFQFIPLPALSQDFQDDTVFAALRVAGANPLMIEQMRSADARLPITEEQYQSVMGTQDGLEAAIAEGRLYLADYSVFDGAQAGSWPESQKFSVAPLALFAIPRGGRSLKPVAIQCGPRPGADNPIFLPRDGDDWRMAKTIVQIADANFHQAVSHLGRTHLFIEPFVIATHNQLSPTHPLSIVLTPHFAGTLAINDPAARILAAAGGLVDVLLFGSIDQSRVFAVKGAQSYLLNVNTSTLPQTLAQRGVADAKRLPDYPYRDDALLIWGAISRWLDHYVSHYYASDAAVQGDTELQKWVAELVAHDGGRVNNVGVANRITTRAQLIELVTMVCFTASAQHAAVNFPQGPLMSYAPAMPEASYAPWPGPQAGASRTDFLTLLPPLDVAASQMNILYFLSSVYFTRLGDYGKNYFTDPIIQKHLATFQQELLEIEAQINERNKTRTPYEFLLPSKIPQSINI